MYDEVLVALKSNIATQCFALLFIFLEEVLFKDDRLRVVRFLENTNGIFINESEKMESGCKIHPLNIIRCTR